MRHLTEPQFIKQLFALMVQQDPLAWMQFVSDVYVAPCREHLMIFTVLRLWLLLFSCVHPMSIQVASLPWLLVL